VEGGRREVGGEMRRGGERWEEEQKLEKDREVVFQTTYEYGLCSKLVESRDLEIVRENFFPVFFFAAAVADQQLSFSQDATEC
jgi:hypothetical protein